jgi:flagellar biosynthesis protein FlhA
LAPGLPLLPFMLLSGLLLAAGLIIPQREAAALAARQAGEREQALLTQAQSKSSIKASLDLPKIELALGRQLSSRFLSDHGELAARVAKTRKRFAKRYGFIVPEIALNDDLDLPPRDYELRIHGSAVARATLPLGDLMIILGNREPPQFPHDPAVEQAFGMAAAIIPSAYAGQAKAAGYEPVEDVAVLLTHVAEVLSRHLAPLLSYGDMRALIDRLPADYQRLLDEITPQHMTLSGLQAILKLLLAEQVSVRNLPIILEAVAEVAPHVKRPEPVTEHVRMRLAAQICADLAEDGALKVLRLGSHWEGAFQRAMRRDARGDMAGFDMEPADIEAFGREALQAIRIHHDAGRRFAVIAPPDIRIHVRMVIERIAPALAVMSHAEIARGTKVEILGAIR